MTTAQNGRHALRRNGVITSLMTGITLIFEQTPKQDSRLIRKSFIIFHNEINS